MGSQTETLVVARSVLARVSQMHVSVLFVLRKDGCATGLEMEEKKSIKILIISPWENLWSLGNEAGVAEEVEMLKGFTQRGYEIHYILPESKDKNSEDKFEKQVHFYRIPNVFNLNIPLHNFFKVLIFYFGFFIISFYRAFSVSRHVRPDVMYGFSVYSAPVVFLIAKLFKARSITKLFGIMDFNRGGNSKLIHFLKQYPTMLAFKIPTDRLLIKDDGTQGDHVARRYKIPSERFRFIPHGVNKEWIDLEVDAEGIRDKLGIQMNDKVIVSLCRLVPSKGVHYLVRVMPKIIAGLDKKVILLIIGDGEQRESLEELVSRLGIQDNVIFAGVVPHSEVPHYLKSSDLLVSVNEFSNMARPTLEAMLCGIPVVAVNVADTSKVVKESETGLLVQSDRIGKDLYSKIIQLLKEDDKRSVMGKKAQEFARENFIDWDDKIREEINMLEELVI